MSFNPDPIMQAQETTFTRKTKEISHPSLRFNNRIVSQTHIKFLDAKLNFEKHLKVVTSKVNKAIGPLQKLYKNLSKTGINDYIKRFCETTPRLWWRNL